MRVSCSAICSLGLILAASLPPAGSAGQGGKATPIVKLSALADARLKREVTTRAADRPLRECLAEWGREAGVGLRTAADYEDRPITIRAAGLPLAKLLDAVAGLYEDHWRVDGKGSTAAYVLEASPARRAKQKQLLEAFDATLKSQLLEMVRDIAKNGPPESVQAEFEPEAREHAEKEWKARGEVLSLLSEDAVSRLLSGRSIRVRLADASGAAADVLWRFAETFAMPDASGHKPQQRANGWVHYAAEPYTIAISSVRGLPLRRLMFTFGTPRGSSSAYGIAVHPDRLAEELDRKLRKLRTGEEQDPAERRRAGGAQLQHRVPATEALRQRAVGTRGALLVALAEAIGANLVADSHIKPPLTAGVLPGLTVEDALSAVAEPHSCYWRVDDGVLRMRSRHWWLDDLAEPPATAVKRWRVALETTGRLSLDESLQLASLAPDQQERVRQVLPETQHAFTPWLRFYALLSPTQRQAARSSKGLRLWTVPEAHRHTLIDLEPGHSMLGNQSQEETLHGGAALLRVVEKTVGLPSSAVPVTEALAFAVDPVPDVAGRLHGVRLGVTVPLPHRREPNARPAGTADSLRQEGLPRPNR